MTLFGFRRPALAWKASAGALLLCLAQACCEHDSNPEPRERTTASLRARAQEFDLMPLHRWLAAEARNYRVVGRTPYGRAVAGRFRSGMEGRMDVQGQPCRVWIQQLTLNACDGPGYHSDVRLLVAEGDLRPAFLAMEGKRATAMLPFAGASALPARVKDGDHGVLGTVDHPDFHLELSWSFSARAGGYGPVLALRSTRRAPGGRESVFIQWFHLEEDGRVRTARIEADLGFPLEPAGTTILLFDPARPWDRHDGPPPCPPL